MALSTSEKEGCREILSQLHVSDLLSLYRTVSKSEKRFKEELIQKIIDESNTAEELLHRKKVYRHIIVQYLNNEHNFNYANSTKEKAIEKVLQLWRKSNTSVKVECDDAASGTAVSQLSIQINSLSIQNSQKDSNQVDKTWLLATKDAQVYQSNAAGISFPNVYKAAPRRTPQKSKAVPCAAANTTDSNEFAVLYASSSGAKPKVKPAPSNSQSTTLSFTVSVTSVSQESKVKFSDVQILEAIEEKNVLDHEGKNSDEVSQATKGPRKKEQ